MASKRKPGGNPSVNWRASVDKPGQRMVTLRLPRAVVACDVLGALESRLDAYRARAKGDYSDDGIAEDVDEREARDIANDLDALMTEIQRQLEDARKAEEQRAES